MLQVFVDAVEPVTVALAVYVSVPTVVVDRTVKLAEPLVVFCGEDVTRVVEVPLDLEKLIENVPEFVALPFASTTFAVALDVEEPSFLMTAGEKLQATPLAGPGVNTIVPVVEETPVPSENVIVQPLVVAVELNVKVARPALMTVPLVAVPPLAGVRALGHPEPAVELVENVSVIVTP